MSFPRVIVSLTSYPARFEAVAQTLEPLFRQTVAPDCIQLWLAEDEFPQTGDLPKSLRDLADIGLEIKWCKRSLKPHTKYFWAMRENPDAIIITIDDDIVYPLNLVETLLQVHYRHPEAIVANRTHIVTLDESGSIAKYSDWMFEQTSICGTPRRDLLATGVGGVLYPPNVFDESVFDEMAINETCLFADDLWLMVHELRLDVPVVSTGVDPTLSYVPGTQESGLYLDNLEGGRNDDFLKVLFERYPSVKKELMSAVNQREAEWRAIEAQREADAGFARRLYHRLIGR